VGSTSQRTSYGREAEQLDNGTGEHPRQDRQRGKRQRAPRSRVVRDAAPDAAQPVRLLSAAGRHADGRYCISSHTEYVSIKLFSVNLHFCAEGLVLQEHCHTAAHYCIATDGSVAATLLACLEAQAQAYRGLSLD
jgi:hypothetical protein